MTDFPGLDRPRAMLVILILWMLTFLPSLGRLEVQSNEHKRIIPAVHMIESGDWGNPKLYGQDYHKKPPLINWMVASSLKISGQTNELAARLPSALVTLAFLAMLILMPSSLFPLPARFIAALSYLSTYAVIEAGRLIEIEATLMSLTGMTCLWWMNIHGDNGPLWKKYLPAGVLLGVAMLLKGPVILAFYLPLVICTLVRERRTRELLSWQQLLSLLIMAAIFAGWALTTVGSSGGGKEATSTWTAELMQQFTPANIDFVNWIRQIAIGLAGFLPWILVIPFFRSKKCLEHLSPGQRTLFGACLAAAVISYAVMNLMPGTRARYSAPLCPALSILCGMFIAAQPPCPRLAAVLKKILLPFILAMPPLAVAALALTHTGAIGGMLGKYATQELQPASWPLALILISYCCLLAWATLRFAADIKTPARLSVLAAATGVAATLFYSVIAVPVICMFDIKRPAAAQANACLDADSTIYVYNLDMPFIFYIRPPLTHVGGYDQLPGHDAIIMARDNEFPGIEAAMKAKNASMKTIGNCVYKRKNHLIVKMSFPGKGE